MLVLLPRYHGLAASQFMRKIVNDVVFVFVVVVAAAAGPVFFSTMRLRSFL